MLLVIKMMNKSNTYSKFNSAIKYMPSSKSIEVLRNNIYHTMPFLQVFIKHYNIEEPIQFREKIQDFFELIFEDFFRHTYIDSRLYEAQAIETIIKDPSIISSEYTNIKDIPNTHTIYTANLQRSQRLVLVNAIDEIANIEQLTKQYGITSDSNLRDIHIDSENQKETIDFIKLSIEILKKKNMNEKILAMLKAQKKMNEDFVREHQVSCLESLYDFFHAFGFLQIYQNTYVSNSIKFGFSDLQYPLSAPITKDGVVGINQVFSKDFLNTLSTESLCFFNAFWFNRFAKECTRLYEVFSTINSLDLWQDILGGNIDSIISDDTLIASLQKSHYIYGLLSESFNIHQSSINSSEIRQGIAFSHSPTRDYTSFYTKLHNLIGKDYSNYFSTYLDGENNFLDDVIFSSTFINLIQCAYRHKTTIFEPLLKNMLDNPHSKNWGIIRNELINGQYVDSISHNYNMVLLSFDIEGFNMPFRFHVSRDTLTDIVKLNNTECIIPEYQGAEDFVIDGEIVPANIIMPISKPHRKIIMENSNNNSANKNLWEHFYFLMNGKFPPHLTQTVKISKKQTRQSRLPICYTSLKDGKRYYKQNNKFVEVDNELAK